MRRLWKAAAGLAALGALAGCASTGVYSGGTGYYGYDPYPYRGAIHVHDGSYWNGRPVRPGRPGAGAGRPNRPVTLPARPVRPPGRPHRGGGRRR